MAAPTALLIAGPPTSPLMWEEVARRLDAVVPTACLDLFDPLPQDSTARGLARLVVDRLRGMGPRPTLVAHGLALPVALHAAPSVPGLRLVLANGPIGRLDPIATAFACAARAPRLAAASLLRPGLLLPWLASSAGLRRAVRNPYVMDRDTVVAICGPTFDTAGRRRAVAVFLASLPEALRSTPAFAGPALLCWGDEDRLHPPAMVDAARLKLPALVHFAVPGGRLLHPVEQPWAMADRLAAWLPAT